MYEGQLEARFTSPHRIIGVAADVDDEHVVPEPMPTMYATFADNSFFGGHVFVHTNANPYSLVTPVTHIIRNLSAERPVEHAATLEEIRAKALEPDRLNSLVFGLFAAVAVVGVMGVLAFSVSARTREFGIRLALGSQPEDLLRSVVAQGAIMAAGGIFAGAAFGFAVVRVAGSYFGDLKIARRPACDRLCVRAARSRRHRLGAAGSSRRPQRDPGPSLGVTA